MVVVGRVAEILQVSEGVDELLAFCGELMSVPLQFSSGESVVEAAVYAGPSCRRYCAVGRSDQSFSVAGGQCVEQCVVRVADRAPDVFVGGLSTGPVGVKQVMARVYQVLPVDGVWWRACGRRRLMSSPRFA